MKLRLLQRDLHCPGVEFDAARASCGERVSKRRIGVAMGFHLAGIGALHHKNHRSALARMDQRNQLKQVPAASLRHRIWKEPDTRFHQRDRLDLDPAGTAIGVDAVKIEAAAHGALGRVGRTDLSADVLEPVKGRQRAGQPGSRRRADSARVCPG